MMCKWKEWAETTIFFPWNYIREIFKNLRNWQHEVKISERGQWIELELLITVIKQSNEETDIMENYLIWRIEEEKSQ